MITQETLYHYCSVESFFGIVSSKKLFLHSGYLTSDSEELTWIWRYKDDVLREFGSAIIPILQLAQKYGELSGDTVTIPFIASFSEVPDLLSQWRAYTGNGVGFSIGFNSSILSQATINPNELRSDLGGRHSVVLAKVIYKEAEHRDAIFNTIRRFTSGQVSTAECGAELFRLAALIKNPAFEEEKEWRIIFTPTIVKSDRDLRTVFPFAMSIAQFKFRQVLNRVHSYFEFSLKNNLVTEGTPVIRVVTRGPKCECDELSIMAFLLSNGFYNVRIDNSHASYR